MRMYKKIKIAKYMLLLFGVLAMTTGFGSRPPGFAIQGNVTAPDGTKLRLYYLYEGKQVIDSATIRNNKFGLSGYFPEPVICTVSCSANQQMRIFIGENAAIRLTGSIDKLFDLAIENASENAIFNEFKKESMMISGQYRVILKQTGGSPHDKSTAAYQLFRQRMDSLTRAFVKAHSSSTAAVLAIIDGYVTNPDREKAAAFYELLSEKAKNAVYAKRILQFTGAATAIVPGQPAPDFALKDLKGRTIKLSDYKGKYILVDFWASWCAPCRKEHPLLRKLYGRFASNNFEFVSISMDADSGAWKQAVANDQLTWPQLNDPRAMDGEVSDRYGVKSLPFNCLIGPDGIIIATKLRSEQLEEFLMAQKFKPTEILLQSSEINSFDQLMELFKGKAVYVDLWATWCGHCKDEFEYNPGLKKFLLENKMEMLYISMDKDNADERWQVMIKGYSLDGYHVRTTESLRNDLIKRFWDGNNYRIPRYLIVKDRAVVEANALRPSDKQKLYEQIRELMNLPPVIQIADF